MTRRASRRRTTQLTIHLVLSLALFIAQAGALLHFYAHVGSGQDPVGLGGQTQVCGECLSFAPLLSAGGTSEHTIFLSAQLAEHGAPVELTSSAPTFCYVAFRSRAPPRDLAIV